MENSEVGHFLFELMSPEKLIFSERVVSVILPSASGHLTVMAHHAPLLASIVLGSVRVSSSSGEKLFAVYGGVADITSSGCCLLAERVAAVGRFSFDELEREILQIRAALEEDSSGGQNHRVEEFFSQLATVGVVPPER